MSTSFRGRRRDDGPCARWVGFQVAGQDYALEILRVQEVLAGADIEPVPGAPPAVLGIINLRGRILPVVDVARCLGLPAQDSACIIVADGGGACLGLRVDRVTGIHNIALAAVKPVPRTHASSVTPLLCGVVSRGQSLLALVDADRLAQAAALAAA